MRALLRLVALFLCAAPAVASTIHIGPDYGVVVREGGGPVRIEVWRNPQTASAPASVRYRTPYTSLHVESVSGTISWSAGDASKKIITVGIIDDKVFRPSSRALVEFYQPVGALLFHPSGNRDSAYYNIEVTDNDRGPSVQVLSTSVREGDSGTKMVEVTISFSSPNPQSHNLLITTANVSAKAPEDYTPFSTMRNVPPDTRAFTVQVGVHGDTRREGPEQFAIELWDSYGFYNSLTNGIVTILDDEPVLDGPTTIADGGTFRLALNLHRSSPTAQTVSIATQQRGVLSVPPSFTVPANTESVSIPVTVLAPGADVIRVALPAAFGGATLEHHIQIYTSAAPRFDPASLIMAVNEPRQVRLTVEPPQPDAVSVPLRATPGLVAPSQVTVPAGGAATFEVSVTTQGAHTLTATLPPIFGSTTALLPVVTGSSTGPIVTRVQPSSGSSAGGTAVVLSGSNFSSDCSVTFGGIAARRLHSVSASTITAIAPPQRAGRVDIRLSCSNGSWLLRDQYMYQNIAPSLVSASPTFGSTEGGTLVRLAGRELLSTCGVSFDGIPAKDVKIESATSLLATAPPHAAGRVAIQLRCATGEASLADAFTFSSAIEPLASIGSITPMEAAPGEIVQLSGSRFRNGDSISVGGVGATIVSTSPEQHTIRIPLAAAGPASVDLVDSLGRIFTTGPIFTVREPAAPRLTRVSPGVAAAGTELHVTGTAFHRGLSFLLGDTQLTVVELASTTATLRVPSGLADGPHTLRVTRGSEILASGPQVQITSGALAILDADPRCANGDSIATLRLTGTGFHAGSRVWIGEAEGTVTFESATSLRVNTAGGEVGRKTITVQSGQSTTTFTNAFRYSSVHQPSTACNRSRRVGR